MINVFGRNYEEIGSDTGGIILKGKIKFKFGNKFLDLLNSNGELSEDLINSLLKEIEELKNRISVLETNNNVG